MAWLGPHHYNTQDSVSRLAQFSRFVTKLKNVIIDIDAEIDARSQAAVLVADALEEQLQCSKVSINRGQTVTFP